MSDYVQLAVRAPQQSKSEVTAPVIVGLFVQGVQTGLVVSQLAHWLNLKRTESTSTIALVVFVTVIGLLVFTYPSALGLYQLIVLFPPMMCVGCRRASPLRLRGGFTFAISDSW